MNYSAIIIEILTALLGLILLLGGLVSPKEYKKGIGYFGVIALLVILGISFSMDGSKVLTFASGLYVSDTLAVYFKQVFIIAAILVMGLSMGYFKRIQENRSEFLALLVFALLGMMVMVSASDLITLYIGLELMTVTLIILTAFDKNSIKSSEAGLKYILLSAMSSGVLLYGMSIIYGITGSVTFTDIVNYFKGSAGNPLMILAMVFLIAGFGFKISMVPFHMWSPDVYEGAPTPITTFLAVGSKAAGFAVLIRILLTVLPGAYSPAAPAVTALAALTIVVGNLVAIPQTNIKRLLAYSSIAQAGYILLGIVAYTGAGVSAMLYYLLLYVFANTGAFAAVIAYSNHTGTEDIEGFAGAWKSSPLVAWTMLISLLSMAGIPPAAGFIGKFNLFVQVVQKGYLWLAFLGVGMGVVSIYYYIRVIRTMLTGEAKDAENRRFTIPMSLKLVMIASMAMTLIMGIFPGPFIDWAGRAASLFLK